MNRQRVYEAIQLIKIFEDRTIWGTLRQAQCKLIIDMEEDKPLWFVYLLLCDDKDFYVGITINLNQRILRHRSKLSKATKEYSAVELVYCEKYSGAHDAAKREKQFKGWSRAKKQMLIDGKLGINTCTEFAVALLRDENRVSLP